MSKPWISTCLVVLGLLLLPVACKQEEPAATPNPVRGEESPATRAWIDDSLVASNGQRLYHVAWKNATDGDGDYYCVPAAITAREQDEVIVDLRLCSWYKIDASKIGTTP